ncbi:MAG TPA: type IV pilus twitching motility protein PilT [Candidatus Saccharimonadia bacterium]|nr:type IV pilus twitching motility protein PilT [Candidatus Saccharimonadia bacterium]
MVERSALKIETMLEQVIKFDASDLHLQVGLPPMLRVDGALKPIDETPVLEAADVEKLVFSILDDDQKEILLKDKEVDFSFAFGNYGRFRVNAFHERGNIAAALRLIPSKVRTLEELQMPKTLQEFTKFPRGLVLVTGPTGSGKSTTLAAMVDKINTERSCHILTIEDPIEYAHSSKKSIVVQREIHYDTYSFAAALRSSLRQDPDVVLIGEMRDLETIAAAVTIAETGHLVLATLHTNSAAQSIDRMIDVFPPHQQQQIRVQLAGMLQGICSQRLVPGIGGGRVVAAEILVATGAVRNIIREGKTHQLDAVIQTGAEYGMQSMDRQLVQLVQEGKISYDEAKNFAIDLQELDRLMRG